jgi:drug/metabolite transporter (DMT)-like permease
MSFQLTIVQTNPFWTSIVALIFFKEKIYWYEVVAMVVCFGGVIGIAFGSPKNITDSDLTAAD